MPACQTIIFAKQPVAGYAKTRLIPALGADKAAQLAHRLLQHAVTEALNADIGPVTLAVTPDLETPYWSQQPWAAQVDWCEQGEGDLGQRLTRVARCYPDQPLLLMGTDCPALTAEILQQGAHALHQTDYCMVPVADGGYALLGMNRFDPCCFEQIAWSTSTVAATTRQRLQARHYSLTELPLLHDVDRADDLQHVPEAWR